MLIPGCGVNLPPSYVCLEAAGRRTPSRPGRRDTMQRLLPAVREALNEAAVKPEEIDRSSASPRLRPSDREPRHHGAEDWPSRCRRSSARIARMSSTSPTRAWPAPSTWSIPSRQRPGLSQRPGRARRIQPGIGSVDSESGFCPCRRRPGAALPADRQGRVPSRCAEGDPAQEWLPLSIPLNTDIRQVGDVRDTSTCRPNLDCPEAVRAGFTRLAWDFPQLNWVREEWFGQGRPDGRCWSRSNWRRNWRGTARPSPDELLLISFDPFGMVVEGATLELAGEACIRSKTGSDHL